MNVIARCAILLSLSILSGCAHAYRLDERTSESHLQRWRKDGIAIGVDLHDPIQLNKMLFEGRCGVDAERSRLELAAIELSVRNDTAEPIEIAARDITLATDITRLTLRVIDDGEAEGMLKNPREIIFDDWCFDPSLPWEPVMWALNLLYYPVNYQSLRTYRGAIASNGFRYGVLAPSESRHGLVYLHWRREPGAPPNPSANRWEYRAAVVIRRAGGGTSRADFTFVRQ